VVTTRTLTAKQNNIDPAFQNAKAEDSTLSILLEQDGLSFLVRNKTTRQLYLSGFIPSKELTATAIDDLLVSFPVRPKQIIVAVEVPLAVVLPAEFRSDDTEWTTHVLGTQANSIFHSKALSMEVHALVDPVILAQLKTVGLEIRHNWLVQMERITLNSTPKMWIHLYGSAVLIMAGQGKKWELVNSFPCENKDELLYHIGNVSEQLNWDRKSLHVELSGLEAAGYLEFISPYFGSAHIFKSKEWGQKSSAFGPWDATAFATLLRL